MPNRPVFAGGRRACNSLLSVALQFVAYGAGRGKALVGRDPPAAAGGEAHGAPHAGSRREKISRKDHEPNKKSEWGQIPLLLRRGGRGAAAPAVAPQAAPPVPPA